MVDFASLLDVNIDDIKAPKALPAGTYHAIISSYKFDKTKPKDGKEPTNTLHIELALQEAGPDIDHSDLEGIDITKRRASFDFYLTEDALYRVKKFLESLGIARTGVSLSELIPEIVQLPCLIEMSKILRSDNSGEFTNRVISVIGEAA